MCDFWCLDFLPELTQVFKQSNGGGIGIVKLVLVLVLSNE